MNVVEMDVYIDKKQKVWVVNINALDDGMNPGLFTCEEIPSVMKSDSLPFRVVEEEGGTLPSEQMVYQLPVDMHQLSTDNDIQNYISKLTTKSYVCVTRNGNETHVTNYDK